MASLMRLKLLMLFTFLLIFGTLFVLLSVVTFIFDFPIWASVVLTLIFVAFQWYTAPWIIAWTARLRYLQPGENPWLEQTVRQLAQEAGVPMPRLAIVPDYSPNAFVFGRTRGTSTLAVHEGLLQKLTKDEVKAVLAHEVGHLRHNDAMVMTIVSAVPLLAFMISRSLLWGGVHVSSERRREGGAAAILLVALVSYFIYFISELLVLWLSRSRESYADAYSAYATRDPGSLASALSKITYGLSIARSEQEPTGLRSFYIGDPSTARREIGKIMEKKDEYDLDRNGVLDEYELHKAMEKEARSTWTRLNELFATHPATFRRILMLKSIEKEMRTTFTPSDAYKYI